MKIDAETDGVETAKPIFIQLVGADFDTYDYRVKLNGEEMYRVGENKDVLCGLVKDINVNLTYTVKKKTWITLDPNGGSFREGAINDFIDDGFTMNRGATLSDPIGFRYFYNDYDLEEGENPYYAVGMGDLDSIKPERPGYSFVGWYETKADGSIDFTKKHDYFKFYTDEDRVCKAVWKPADFSELPTIDESKVTIEQIDGKDLKVGFTFNPEDFEGVYDPDTEVVLSLFYWGAKEKLKRNDEPNKKGFYSLWNAMPQIDLSKGSHEVTLDFFENPVEKDTNAYIEISYVVIEKDLENNPENHILGYWGNFKNVLREGEIIGIDTKIEAKQTTPTPTVAPVQVDIVKEDTAYDNLENFKRIDLSDMNLKATIDVADQIYTGKELRPKATVKITQNGKSVTLTEGTDYIRSYSHNVDAGTAVVTIKGNGLYTGTIAKEFSISKKPISKFVIAASSVKKGDSVQSVTNNISVFDGTELLEAGKDYSLDTSKVNTNTAGKTVVVVNGTGNYAGTKNVSVPVVEVSDAKYLIRNAAFKNAADGVKEYSGKAAKFNTSQFSVTADDGSVIDPANYSISAKNVTNVGSGYVLVKGKGKFKGQIAVPVEIKAPVVTLNVTNPADVTFNGKLQHPKVTVTATVAGKTVTLKANKDYVITYANNLHASTDAEKASLQVIGIGNYAASNAVTKDFRIKQLSIKKAAFKGTKTKGITATYNKHMLVEGVDYKIEGWEDDAKGTKSKATITGLRDYAGSGAKIFRVN